MNQDVQSQIFLKANHRSDFFTHALGVVCIRELALGPRSTRATNLGGLREGTNRRGRQQRQVKALALEFIAKSEVLALAIGFSQLCDTLTQFGANNAGSSCTLCKNLAGRLDGLGNRIPALAHAAGKGDNLGNLLVGEGQPRVEVRVKHGVIPLFERGVVRDVLKRSRSGNGQGCGVECLRVIKSCNCAIEVGAPNVAAINDTRNEGNLGQIDGSGLGKRTTAQVQAQSLNAGGGKRSCSA